MTDRVVLKGTNVSASARSRRSLRVRRGGGAWLAYGVIGADYWGVRIKNPAGADMVEIGRVPPSHIVPPNPAATRSAVTE